MVVLGTSFIYLFSHLYDLLFSLVNMNYLYNKVVILIEKEELLEEKCNKILVVETN